MQVMVPRLQEVSRMQQNQQQKSGLQQHEVANNINHNIQKQQRTVVKSSEDQKSLNDSDPRKKGKNKYTKNKNNNNKEKKNSSNMNKHNNEHIIDIKI
jgi:2,3-bisphosphoglycerate-independent phosphoglycerate mutase